ncbi:MAG: hypothetical protein AAB840_02115, partial [Patescibacteria group bacterium]
RTGHVSKRSSRVMEELYRLFKGITHRDIKSISGKEYDEYKKKTEQLVDELRYYIEGQKK